MLLRINTGNGSRGDHMTHSHFDFVSMQFRMAIPRHSVLNDIYVAWMRWPCAHTPKQGQELEKHSINLWPCGGVIMPCDIKFSLMTSTWIMHSNSMFRRANSILCFALPLPQTDGFRCRHWRCMLTSHSFIPKMPQNLCQIDSIWLNA